MRFRAAWVSSLVLSCASPDTHQTTATGALPEGAVARVGDLQIASATVSALAAAQERTPEQALEGAIRDAVLAAELRRTDPPRSTYLRRVVLARRLSEGFMAQAREQGPPTAEEVEQFTRRHWWELDRPAAARVMHAVVLCRSCVDPGAARAVAERVRAATEGATEEEMFKASAKAVEAGEFELRVEKLQPVTADGRVVSLDSRPNRNFSFGHYDPQFAAAANALSAPGDQSDVVESSFGFHVMLLLEQVPARQLPFEERSELLRDEIIAARGKALADQVLGAGRETVSIEVLRSFEQDTEQLLDNP